MKGLLLSLLVFIFYVGSSVLFSHLLRPKRHPKLFLSLLLLSSIIFFALYWATPMNFWFLAQPWQAAHVWLDMLLGFLILLFNVHSYIDWFFGFNGGFSTSLMLVLLDKNKRGATTDEILQEYECASGENKIHAWRIPRLQETGYLKVNPHTGICTLTFKGKAIAQTALLAKKIFNLGIGG